MLQAIPAIVTSPSRYFASAVSRPDRFWAAIEIPAIYIAVTVASELSGGSIWRSPSQNFGILVGLVMSIGLLAPGLLVAVWLPLRLAAGPDSRSWAVAAAAFIPPLVLAPTVLIYPLLEPASSAILLKVEMGALLLWQTRLVFVGIHASAPQRAWLASSVFFAVMGGGVVAMEASAA